jgi:single-strand DNA-binding protein
MSLNRACIIGNLGADPEVKTVLPGGLRVATLRIATNSKWTDKDGTSQEATEWHRVVVWGRLAEIAGQYLKKGRQVYIEGRIQTREWKDQSGQKRYSTEIHAQQMQMLGAKSQAESDVASTGAVTDGVSPEVQAALNEF